MSESEPRRSVRSTKGQHKALDQLEQSPDQTKKRSRKTKKEKEPEEEIIRCVCGATEQDEDSGEPWIACDKCTAWQHNVCMGIAVYTEDIPKEYFCEQCKPEDHKELLEGIERGEKVWEMRRQAHEESKTKKKRGGGGKKGKKRASDVKEDSAQPSSQKDKEVEEEKPKAKRAKQKGKPTPSPAPEAKKETTKSGAGSKRKSRDPSEDQEAKNAQKLRKVSESQSVPVPPPAYEPPEDIPKTIPELVDNRQPLAKALVKSITHAIGAVEKKFGWKATDEVPHADRALRMALQVERAVFDSHANHKEYATRIKTLTFNLKNNPELCHGLLSRTLTPSMLAVMSSDELASSELQRKTAEMKAQAEKQSILLTEEGPRVRRTHKGEEMVENDSFTVPKEDKPTAFRRQSVREPQQSMPQGDAAAEQEEEPTESVELPENIETVAQTQASSSSAAPAAEAKAATSATSPNALRIDTQPAAKSDFDINKVFSSVRSPSAGHQRRSSQQVPQAAVAAAAAAAVDDPDVDRLLQDDDREESPPYSPTDETDPNAVWRGQVIMPSIATFHATARHAGGANLSKSLNLPWTTLMPKDLTVHGRIPAQKATEYLCGLRYSQVTDVVVAELLPATDAARPEFLKLIEYFLSKQRYAVVGDKGIGNVRDTYLIPVPAGSGNHPEFMLNLEDNFLPEVRIDPMLLVVFVYRNDPGMMEKVHGSTWAAQSAQSPAVVTPTPAGFAQRHPSMNAPGFSPTTPQGAFSNYPTPRNSLPPPPQHQQMSPAPPLSSRPYQQQELLQMQQMHQQTPPQHTSNTPTPTPGNPSQFLSDHHAIGQAKQKEGEQVARDILGPLISCPTVCFILPNAHKMTPAEWHLIHKIVTREPKAREDLDFLSNKIREEETNANRPPPLAVASANRPVPGPAQDGAAQVLAPAPAPASAPTPAPINKVSTTPVPVPHVPHSAVPPRAPQGPPASGGAQN